jgi:uncharacterized membrane protein (UPF0127 family)
MPRGFAVFFVMCGMLVSCLGRGSASGLETTELVIERQDGQKRHLRVELARSEEERALGLMFRTKLDEGRGMLFIFEREQSLNFWMKNTLLPLSIAYIAGDGRIVDIQDMVPQSLETVRSRFPARYALEVPQGWFSKVGVRPGDLVKVQSLPSK